MVSIQGRFIIKTGYDGARTVYSIHNVRTAAVQCKDSCTKGGLISEGTLTLVPLSTKNSKSLSWAENLNKLFTVIGGKFKFSAQKSDLAPFFW